MTNFLLFAFFLIVHACFGSAGDQKKTEQASQVAAVSYATGGVENSILEYQASLLKDIMALQPEDFSYSALSDIAKTIKFLDQEKPSLVNILFPEKWQKKLTQYDPSLRSIMRNNLPITNTLFLFLGIGPAWSQALGSLFDARKHILYIFTKKFFTAWFQVLVYSDKSQRDTFEKIWTIKKTCNPEILLLIPRTVTADRKNRAFSYLSSLTETEYELGLKIDHLQDLAFDTFYPVDKFFPVYDDPESIAKLGKIYQDCTISPVQLQADYLLRVFEEIFVTRAEYALNHRTAEMPRWTFSFDGHGFTESIYGMHLDQFKEILSFCASKIVTVFFSYAACDTLGAQSQKIYGEFSCETHGSTYPFTILTNGVANDAMPIDPNSQPVSAVNLLYQYEVNQAKKYDNLKQISERLFGEILPNRFCHVRFPGHSWFTMLDLKENSFPIKKVLAQTRTKPLFLDRIFYGIKAIVNPVLLLYTPIIPFEVNAQNVNVQFVPMHNSRAYYFASLNINSQKNCEPLRKYLPPIHVQHIVLSYLENLGIYSLMTSLPLIRRTGAMFWFKKFAFIVDQNKSTNSKANSRLYDDCIIIINDGGLTSGCVVCATIAGIEYNLDGDAAQPIEYLANAASAFFQISKKEDIDKLIDEYETKYKKLSQLIITKRIAHSIHANKNNNVMQSAHGKYTAD